MSVCLSVSVSLCLCLTLSLPPPPPSRLFLSLILCLVLCFFFLSIDAFLSLSLTSFVSSFFLFVYERPSLYICDSLLLLSFCLPIDVSLCVPAILVSLFVSSFDQFFFSSLILCHYSFSYVEMLPVCLITRLVMWKCYPVCLSHYSFSYLELLPVCLITRSVICRCYLQYLSVVRPSACALY